ncbi:hypothetical protein [Methylobacterium tarhaniae]|uniref:hypothetical protein n=1 Tax=Methylobacterium tarhaniae TaxID=1187852 RepID=UPI003D05E6D7
MKLYMALNEAGTSGDIGLHTKIAALSAKKFTTLDPVLLYCGEANEQTRWLQEIGVEVVRSELPYLDLILKLTQEGRYWTASVGHWLRTNVCLEEKEDEIILYTDVDVLFLKNVNYSAKPKYFAAAPEFNPNSWNYFNAGVMIANMHGLRSQYQEFEAYLRENIDLRTYNFHDQIAYNDFYRGRWDKLPVGMNWKPYWGINDDASIIHFHGPKLHAIDLITKGEWNWDNNYGLQLGSLFAAHANEYHHYYRKVIDLCPELPADVLDRLNVICDQIDKYKQASPDPRIDLSFMDYRMYPE